MNLWLGVICQSNLEIAGSPRNIFRYRLTCKLCGGRALDERLVRKSWRSIKLRIPYMYYMGLSTSGLSSAGKRETTQIISLRSLNLCLSGKGSHFPKTPRRLAQKQPSFKESVTAHWSRKSGAEDVSRLKQSTEDYGCLRIYAVGVVGERSDVQ